VAVTGAELRLAELILSKIKGCPKVEPLDELEPSFKYPFQIDMGTAEIGKIVGDCVEEYSGWPKEKLVWKGKRHFSFARLCAEPRSGGGDIWVNMGLKTVKGDWYPERWPLHKFLDKCAQHDAVLAHVLNAQECI
jgi:hypothetical protein